MVEDSLSPSDVCWCGHRVQWHYMQVCRWCVRLERRYPNSNHAPRHEIVIYNGRRMTHPYFDPPAGDSLPDVEPWWVKGRES